jgi:hypothetical protein
MIAPPFDVRKGGFPALSALRGICSACVFMALISCSSSYKSQEDLVRDLFEAARKHDVSKAAKLMPRLSLLKPDDQERALDNLSRIGTYKIVSSRKEGEAVFVTLRYRQGGDVMSLIIPVRKEGESWLIGDDFSVRRSLEGQIFERSN